MVPNFETAFSTQQPPKKGKNDILSVNAALVNEGSKLKIETEQTKRFFERKRFYLGPGCKVVVDGKAYYCTEVRYGKAKARHVKLTLVASGNIPDWLVPKITA